MSNLHPTRTHTHTTQEREREREDTDTKYRERNKKHREEEEEEEKRRNTLNRTTHSLKQDIHLHGVNESSQDLLMGCVERINYPITPSE